MDNHLISPKDVKDHIRSSENGHTHILLDIRAEDEYKDWNIKGSINIPINSLISEGNYLGIKEMLSKLPKDKMIVTICAKGLNSQVASSILREMGYNSVSMEKGMKGWNENFDIFKIDFTDFTVIQFARIGKGCLSYLIYDNSTKETALIEPAIFIHE